MVRRINQHTEIIDLIYEKSAKLIYDLLNRIGVAKWKDNTEQESRLVEELADMLASTRAYADLLGRRRVLLKTQQIIKFTEAEEPNPIIPSVPFQQAIDDLVSRMPVLAKSADEVRQIYAVEHSFALAQSTSANLTERIRDELAKAIREGKPVKDASDLISKIGDWNYSYANVVYRTNLNTSYHAGQFQILKDPEIREIMPAFRYVATLDTDVRPNHRAMHNLIASVDDEIWLRLSCPLGFRCRCSLVTIDARELQRMGINPSRIPKARIPAGAYPDYPEFGKRPDWNIYGAF